MVEVSAPSRRDALHRGKNLRICRSTIGGPETWCYEHGDCYYIARGFVYSLIRGGGRATPQRDDSSHAISACSTYIHTYIVSTMSRLPDLPALTYEAGGSPASKQVRLLDSRLGQRMTILTDLHAVDADHPHTDKDARPRAFPQVPPLAAQKTSPTTPSCNHQRFQTLPADHSVNDDDIYITVGQLRCNLAPRESGERLPLA